MNLKQVLKDWMLPIAMLTGASLYLIYHVLPEPCHKVGPMLESIVSVVQPMLIFSMLFLTFSRVEPREMKPHRWHFWLLLIQGGFFVALGLIAYAVLRSAPGEHHDWVVLIESAMLCMICPTATAAAVVTRKLGGDVAGITTYTVLVNILVAFVVPLIVPLIQPMEGVDFWMAFSMILAKVFPLLIMPCLSAWLVRYLLPRFHRWLLNFPDLAFYIWSISLTLAIAVSVKYLVASTVGVTLISLMALISLLCCIFQFVSGRFVGSRYKSGAAMHERKVTAGQALGQKNTVFVIWMAYTFMTPETAIVGGLYSIWHNVYNAWQLYRMR